MYSKPIESAKEIDVWLNLIGRLPVTPPPKPPRLSVELQKEIATKEATPKLQRQETYDAALNPFADSDDDEDLDKLVEKNESVLSEGIDTSNDKDLQSEESCDDKNSQTVLMGDVEEPKTETGHSDETVQQKCKRPNIVIKADSESTDSFQDAEGSAQHEEEKQGETIPEDGARKQKSQTPERTEPTKAAVCEDDAGIKKRQAPAPPKYILFYYVYGLCW